jgi:hypothetical protein
MCRRDPLFFVNSFVWSYNPRLPSGLRRQPFILYEFQANALCELILAKGVILGYDASDVLIEKSRDMGASWLCVIADMWCWQFQEFASFLWLSRTQDYVDKTGDPKSLFWKADWMLTNQPAWLAPRMDWGADRTKLHLRNPETLSVIDGESTTGEAGRGDRRTSILLDEFASVKEGAKILSATADTTDCRIFNSTPKGTGNAFYLQRQSMQAEGQVILRFHWSEHPDKRKGLYSSDGGRVKYLDPGFEYPVGYKFICDGKLRSLWYDKEERRRSSKMEIAQEIDIDYLASGSQFFDQEVLERCMAETAQLPLRVGEILWRMPDCSDGTFEDRATGRLRLWISVGSDGRPPIDRNYVLGVDVSAGSDASNSVISVVDTKTRWKVAEFSTVNVFPNKLAEYAVSLGRWFKGHDGEAFIVWEANGPGLEFGGTIIELGYMNYYRRGSGRRRLPGWFSSGDEKLKLLGDYRRALAAGTFVNRSKEAIQECQEYVYMPDGSVAHAGSANTEDPTGAKHNHGDRVIADALACLALGGEREQESGENVLVPRNSFLYRRQEALRAGAEENFW